MEDQTLALDGGATRPPRARPSSTRLSAKTTPWTRPSRSASIRIGRCCGTQACCPPILHALDIVIVIEVQKFLAAELAVFGGDALDQLDDATVQIVGPGIADEEVVGHDSAFLTMCVVRNIQYMKMIAAKNVSAISSRFAVEPAQVGGKTRLVRKGTIR